MSELCKITGGGPGIETFVRANGDTLFYKAATNEFAVLSRNSLDSPKILRSIFEYELCRMFLKLACRLPGENTRPAAVLAPVSPAVPVASTSPLPAYGSKF